VTFDWATRRSVIVRSQRRSWVVPEGCQGCRSRHDRRTRTILLGLAEGLDFSALLLTAHSRAALRPWAAPFHATTASFSRAFWPK